MFRAITSEEELTNWFPNIAKLEARVGGLVEFKFQRADGEVDHTVVGKVLEIVQDKKFSMSWKNTADPKELPSGESESVIRWGLVEDAGHTIRTVTLRRLTRGTALGFAPGMHAFLDRLAAHLNHERLPDWMEQYDAVKGSYPSWQG